MSTPTNNSAPKGNGVRVEVTERETSYERWLCWFCGEWHTKEEYDQCPMRQK